ncbi:MAG: succinate dehydrogenase, hydrophobic membrane anchor protein [Nitrosomonadales bacterium]
MVDRIVTGAHYGLRDWLIQRVTAVVMTVYIVFMAGWLLWHSNVDYDIWTRLFASNVVRSFSLLFLFALFYHAWVGVRDIVMDYIKPAFLRLAIYVVVILALILYVIWSVQILWSF